MHLHTPLRTFDTVQKYIISKEIRPTRAFSCFCPTISGSQRSAQILEKTCSRIFIWFKYCVVITRSSGVIGRFAAERWWWCFGAKRKAVHSGSSQRGWGELGSSGGGERASLQGGRRYSNQWRAGLTRLPLTPASTSGHMYNERPGGGGCVTGGELQGLRGGPRWGRQLL